jgi:hypothetical protein
MPFKDFFDNRDVRQWNLELPNNPKYLINFANDLLAALDGLVIGLVEIVSCSIEKFNKSMRS